MSNPELELRKSEVMDLIDGIDDSTDFEKSLEKSIALMRSGLERGDPPQVVIEIIRLTIKKYGEFEKEIIRKYGDRGLRKQ